VLVNLLSNAIKFTDTGYVRLDVSTKENTENFVTIEFRVEDSGVGIAPDKLNTIFERFTQARPDTTRKYGGTGLGLSIVKNLVELQGGHIILESRPGIGSIFIVTIPFKNVSTEQSQHYQAKPGTEEINVLSGTRVLIAEDNKMNQRLAIEVLKGFGIVTEVAENGKEAIEKCKNQSFDLVLMDIQMAEVDGYQATAFIRKKLKKEIPIIAMTAHALVGEKEKCLALGMNDYISKPFKTAELFRKMYNLLHLKVDAVEPGDSQPLSNEMGVVNLDYLKSIIGAENPAFIREMVSLFLTEVPENMVLMDKAYEDKDYATLGKTAHKMQTSVAMMGISELAGTLDAIEDKCRSRVGIKEIPTIYPRLKSECIKAIHELQLEKEKL
jgi:CheY-like chemotaxis protein